LSRGDNFLALEEGLLTTAMGIMPHRDPQRALDLAFSLDIPFWPQLPNISFSEDTYVQTVTGLPGAEVDYEDLRIVFDDDRFYEGLEEYLSLEPDSDYFALNVDESATYGGFLDRASDGFPALRGQFMGPISLCLMVKYPDGKPVIYRDEVREIAIRHVAAKVNRHLKDLRAINPRSFVWVDEPGLEFLFAGISGYTAERAREDLALFLSLLDGPRGVHLCGNPDWDFLLQSKVQLISLDAYNNRQILMGYRHGFAQLLQRGGFVAWGAVPTHTYLLDAENPASLAARIRELWRGLEEEGIEPQHIIDNSLITPATCCLINPDLTATVEKAFTITREVRDILLG
jgi:hypothetical protein